MNMPKKDPKKKWVKPDGPPPANATEQHKYRIECMMKKIDTPIELPKLPQKQEKFSDPREFFKNISGSSAGAGSGEFHVFRATRRREMKRQEFFETLDEEQAADALFEETLKRNKEEAEDNTAKKRAKRAKLKQKQKEKKLAMQKEKEKEEKKRKKESEKNEKIRMSGEKQKDIDSAEKKVRKEK